MAANNFSDSVQDYRFSADASMFSSFFILEPTFTEIILSYNPVYLGIMAQGKKVMRDYRSKKIIMKPPEQWIVVERTHDSIISQELWDRAHESIDLRKNPVRLAKTKFLPAS